jgi:hypothetical protein
MLIIMLLGSYYYYMLGSVASQHRLEESQHRLATLPNIVLKKANIARPSFLQDDVGKRSELRVVSPLPQRIHIYACRSCSSAPGMKFFYAS